MRRLILLLCLLALSAGAQVPDKLRVLILPVGIHGDYKPLSPQEFTTELQGQVQQMAKADLEIPRGPDLSGLGYVDSGQPPALDQARRLCAAYNATNACWLSIRFRPELTPAAAGQPGVLSVAGAARFWVLRASDGKVTLDEPVSVVRSVVLADGVDPAKAGEQLGRQCAHDLAQQIVTIGSQRAAAARLQAWGPRQPRPQAAAPGLSANYRNMASSIEDYRDAVERGDLISSTDGQRAALFNWRKLSPQEQAAIDKQYPGTRQWMDGGAYYNVNGYWRY